jgi:ketosteroid isomerase-like protein
MQETDNVRLTREAFEAFTRGDIPTLLSYYDDDIVWRPVTGAGAHVPVAGRRQGKPAVADFFRLVAENFNFSRFETTDHIASGDKVVTLGHYTATTPMNRTIDSDFAMVVTIKNGKVTQFQEFTDSAAMNAAFAIDAAAV